MELTFLYTVVTSGLLLSTKLKAIFRILLAALAMLTGSVGTTLKSTFACVASVAL
jgi:hypothetical protein